MEEKHKKRTHPLRRAQEANNVQSTNDKFNVLRTRFGGHAKNITVKAVFWTQEEVM